MAMIPVDENFFDELLTKVMPELKKTNTELTFKPNKNLGEGRASDRNLKHRQALLSLLKDTVYDPMTELLKSDKTLDEKIKAVNGYIDDYIHDGQQLVKDNLTGSYQTGIDDAITHLKKAAKEQSVSFKPKIPENPAKLQQIINMAQHNIEDYGLRLRGRLISAIETEAWMSNYGSN